MTRESAAPDTGPSHGFGERPASRTGRRVTYLVLALMFALIAGLPFILMTIPNPTPVKVTDLAQAGNGTYLTFNGSTFHLFPYAAPQSSFPEGSLEAAGGCVVQIKVRNVDNLSAYGLFRFETGQSVAGNKRVTDSKVVEIVPTVPLAAGKYVIAASRGGAYGGTDYFYFSVGGRF